MSFQIVVRKGANCESYTQNVYINSYFLPIPQSNDYQTILCDALNDGSENIDLSLYNSNIIASPNNFSFSYYSTVLGADTANSSFLISNFSNCNLSNTNNTVYVRVVSSDGCYSVAALKFSFIDSPRITMEDAYPLCEFRSVVIEAGHGFNSYLWSNAQTTNTMVATVPGNYWVVVTEDHVGAPTCDSRKDFTIFLSNPATITSIETVDWTHNENTIEVFVTGLGSYEYSLDGIQYQDNNIFENLYPGIYQVFVRDKHDCGITDVEVYLLNYPKFFTPNGDGHNDTWKVKFSQFEENFLTQIFDRYGKLIKVLNNNESWDGTYNGKQLPSDDYWFQITRNDGRIHKGHFAMKR
jgi:gliding motility-associated-like protein